MRLVFSLPFIRTRGGVARRTGPPECSGTWSWSLEGLRGRERV